MKKSLTYTIFFQSKERLEYYHYNYLNLTRHELTKIKNFQENQKQVQRWLAKVTKITSVKISIFV